MLPLQVIDHPVLVLGVLRQREGVQPKIRGRHVQRVVAHTVEIVLAVREHLRVVLFEIQQLLTTRTIVEEMKVAGYGIAHPVVLRSLVQHRAFTARPDALDHFVLRIVVGCFRIFTCVHLGETLHPFAKLSVVRIGESKEHEPPHAFACVEPVGLRDELAMIRSIFSEFRELGAHLAVLFVVPFERFLVELQHRVVSAERV
jgi:hypothetical protein